MIEQIIVDEIYHTLRQKLVTLGYLPDIMDYDIMNSDTVIVNQQVLAYEAACKAIKDGPKGYCIDLISFSSNASKGEKKTPRIVIDVHQFLPGDIGNDTTVWYKKINNYYVRQRNSPLVSNLTFCIYAVAANSSQMVMLNHIIMNTIPALGYMKPTDSPDLLESNNFFVALRDKGHTPDLPAGIIERYFIYEIPDIQEIETITIPGNIVPISEIELILKTLEEDTP